MNFIKPPTLYVVEGHKPLYVGVWGNSLETNRLSEFFRNFSISHPALLFTSPKKAHISQSKLFFQSCMDRPAADCLADTALKGIIGTEICVFFAKQGVLNAGCVPYQLMIFTQPIRNSVLNSRKSVRENSQHPRVIFL